MNKKREREIAALKETIESNKEKLFDENEFKMRLHDLRIEKGFTFEALGKLMDMSKGNPSKWENEENALPRYREACKLAKIYGVTTDYLLAVSDYRKTKNEELGAPLGLSDTSIEVLKFIRSMESDPGTDEDLKREASAIIGFINLTLEMLRPQIERNKAGDDFPLSSILVELYDYINASTVKASSTGNTIECLTFEMENGVPDMFTAHELYVSKKRDRIIKHLDKLRESFETRKDGDSIG